MTPLVGLDHPAFRLTAGVTRRIQHDFRAGPERAPETARIWIRCGTGFTINNRLIEVRDGQPHGTLGLYNGERALSGVSFGRSRLTTAKCFSAADTSSSLVWCTAKAHKGIAVATPESSLIALSRRATTAVRSCP